MKYKASQIRVEISMEYHNPIEDLDICTVGTKKQDFDTRGFLKKELARVGTLCFMMIIQEKYYIFSYKLPIYEDFFVTVGSSNML